MTDSTPNQAAPFAEMAAKLEWICSKINLLAIIGAAILPILVCADVTARLFKFSVPGALELEENLLMLITFAFMPWLQSRERQMSIDFVYKRLNSHVKVWADVFVDYACLAGLAVLSYESLQTLLSKVGTLSMELYLPLEIYYIVPVLGLAATFIVMAAQTLRRTAQACVQHNYLAVILAIALAVLLFYMPFWYRESDFELSMLAIGGIAFMILFFLMFMKMPIAWAMCIVGGLGCVAIYRSVNAAFAVIGSTPYTASANFNLVVLPLFVLMGCMILHAGISQELFTAANKWLGHFPGGIGMASVAGCTGFAAVCGDSLATAVTMGSVALPEMEKLKYDPALATGALAAGGTLGILIPPSAGFIIYGIITEVSIGRLFMAGLVPGLMLAGLFMAYIHITALRKPHMAPSSEKCALSERIRCSMGFVPIMILFMLVLGSIVFGICSPTEGGGIGVAGALVYALARRRVTWANLYASLEETAILTSRIMAILIGVGVLGFFLAQSRLPFLLADFITNLHFNRYVIFGVIVLLYVVLGCMMNVIPMLMLTIPSIYPAILAMGFDPVWFGVVSVMIMEMGQITPPVGVVVFALSGVAKNVPMETIFKGIVPFVFLMILGVILVTIFPSIATWLPYTLMGPELM